MGEARRAVRNALTFDIEEYFHAEALASVVRPEEWPGLESRVVDGTQRLLDILDYAAVHATFFVLGWVAERQAALVREIGDRGHEVACHGYAHRMIQRLSPREFAADVARAKSVLEDASGAPVIGYRAPTFSVVRDTLWSLDVLRELDFRYDSSVFPIVHDRYGIPDAPRFAYRIPTAGGGGIVELPLSTIEVLGHRIPVAGGGYFRLAPYAVTRRAIRSLNAREGQPAVVYLHPWELDRAQPRRPRGVLARMRHTVNVGATEGKLRRLLQDFQFGPVAEVLADAGLLVTGEPR